MEKKLKIFKTLLLLTPFLWAASSLAQDQTVPVTSIGPVRKTVAKTGIDTVIVSLPPFEGLNYPSCGQVRFDTTQAFTSAGLWGCVPAKAASWEGSLRASVKKIGGATNDSLKVLFYYINDNGSVSVPITPIFAFGTSSTVANVGDGAIHSSALINTLGPARALAVVIQNTGTDAATRWEFYFDVR